MGKVSKPDEDPAEAAAAAEPVEPARPLLRVVGSDATPEEIAALVAVFAALEGGAASAPRPTPEWEAPHRKLRPTYPHGPGGWRASSLPR